MTYDPENITLEIGDNLIHGFAEDSVIILDKKSSYEEVFAFALKKYKGNEGKAARFCRGWFMAGGKQ